MKNQQVKIDVDTVKKLKEAKEKTVKNGKIVKK
jgi:hypothetical protein